MDHARIFKFSGGNRDHSLKCNRSMMKLWFQAVRSKKFLALRVKLCSIMVLLYSGMAFWYVEILFSISKSIHLPQALFHCTPDQSLGGDREEAFTIQIYVREETKKKKAKPALRKHNFQLLFPAQKKKSGYLYFASRGASSCFKEMVTHR